MLAKMLGRRGAFNAGKMILERWSFMSFNDADSAHLIVYSAPCEF
jgi:hypothetical protein